MRRVLAILRRPGVQQWAWEGGGMAVICIGVGFVYWPAAIVLAGVYLVAVAQGVGHDGS